MPPLKLKLPDIPTEETEILLFLSFIDWDEISKPYTEMNWPAFFQYNEFTHSNYLSKNFCNFPKTLIFLLFQGFMTCVYLCIGNVYKLMNYMAFVEGIFFGFTITGLIILRITQPKMKRPIKVSRFFFL